MTGQLWKDLMAAVKETIQFILNTPTLKDAIKITVICYGNAARVVFKEETPSLDLLTKIIFHGGGTDFEIALGKTYDIIIESITRFDIFTVGFLTDGHATYPQKIIDKINADAAKIKKRINFNCILFGSASSNLEKISKDLNARYSNAIGFEQLNRSFREIIKPRQDQI